MWVNPTNGFIRQCDSKGCGHYGASRGDRRHTGVDYIATPDQAVKAITSDTVTIIGHTYSDDLSFRYVTIEADNGLVVRQLYVLPSVVTGMRVNAGDVIGTYQRLGIRYPGITEHVHIDIWIDNGTTRPWSSGAKPINPATVIPLPDKTAMATNNPNAQPATPRATIALSSTLLALALLLLLGMELLPQGVPV